MEILRILIFDITKIIISRKSVRLYRVRVCVCVYISEKLSI